MGALKQFLIGIAEKMGLDPADPDAVDEAKRRLKQPSCRACGKNPAVRDSLCHDCIDAMWSRYNDIYYTEEELDEMERMYREERELEEGVKER